MPVTSDNVGKAEAWLSANQDNPDGTITMEAYDNVSTQVANYYKSLDDKQNTTVDGGKIEDSPAPAELPTSWRPEKKKRGLPSMATSMATAGVPGLGFGIGSMGNHEDAQQDEMFFEPSVDKAKEYLSNPENVSALGYDTPFTPQALETLSEDSPEYQKYADNLWQQAVLQAKEKGTRGISRYSKMGFGEDPGGVARATAAEYAIPFLSGVDDNVLLGAGKAVAEIASQGSTDFIEDLNKKHPIVNVAGNAAAYAIPFGAGAQITKGAVKAVGYTAAKKAAEASGKVLTKDLLKKGTAAGAATNLLEGGGADLVDGVQSIMQGGPAMEGTAADQVIKHGSRALIGGALGLGGEALGGLLAKGSRMISENPRISNDLKLLREAGGDTSVATGIKANPEIKENVFRATTQGPNGEIMGTAEDIAAKKVSGKIKDQLQGEERLMVQKSGENLENYYSTPEGMEQHTTAPLFDSMADAVLSRIKKGDLGGDVNTQGGVVKQFRERLKEMTDTRVVTAQEAKDLVEKNPGWRSMTVDDAEKLMPGVTGNRTMDPESSAIDWLMMNRPKSPAAAKSNQRVVFAPMRKNAKELEEAGRHIDDMMRDPKNAGGEKEALVVAQKGLKSMRDQFKPNKYTPESAVLDDGTVVKGLGALQRTHHEARNALENAQKDVGFHKRNRPDEVIKSYQMPGTHTDVSQSIKDAAKRAGVLKELEDSAGTGAFQRLRGSAEIDKGGIRQSLLRQTLFRLDPVMRHFGSVTKNPRYSDSIPKPREILTVDPKKVKSIISQGDESASKLTAAEQDAIHSYTSRHSDKVGTPEWNSAVKKMEVQNPTEAGTLYSGTRIPEAELDKIVQSGNWSIGKPTSTSYNRGISSAMAVSRPDRGVPVLIEYHDVPSGVNLTTRKLGIAGTGGEREIMLTSGNYRIVDKGIDDEGNRVLTAVFDKPKKAKENYPLRAGRLGRVGGALEDTKEDRKKK